MVIKQQYCPKIIVASITLHLPEEKVPRNLFMEDSKALSRSNGLHINKHLDDWVQLILLILMVASSHVVSNCAHDVLEEKVNQSEVNLSPCNPRVGKWARSM